MQAVRFLLWLSLRDARSIKVPLIAATLIALGTAMLSPYVGTLFNCDSLRLCSANKIYYQLQIELQIDSQLILCLLK